MALRCRTSKQSPSAWADTASQEAPPETSPAGTLAFTSGHLDLGVWPPELREVAVLFQLSVCGVRLQRPELTGASQGRKNGEFGAGERCVGGFIITPQRATRTVYEGTSTRKQALTAAQPETPLQRPPRTCLGFSLICHCQPVLSFPPWVAATFQNQQRKSTPSLPQDLVLSH